MEQRQYFNPNKCLHHGSKTGENLVSQPTKKITVKQIYGHQFFSQWGPKKIIMPKTATLKYHHFEPSLNL